METRSECEDECESECVQSEWQPREMGRISNRGCPRSEGSDGEDGAAREERGVRVLLPQGVHARCWDPEVRWSQPSRERPVKPIKSKRPQGRESRREIAVTRVEVE